MNKKGFAAAGMLYSLLILFLLLTVLMLNSMQNKKNILDNLKSETVEALYCTREDCNLLNYGNALASDIASGKTALVSGRKVTGTMQKKSASTINLKGGESKTYETGYYSKGWTVACKDEIAPVLTLGTATMSTSSSSGSSNSSSSSKLSLIIPFTASDNIGIESRTCKYSTTNGTYSYNANSVSSSSCTISGIKSGTTYYYKVCVKDKDGNETCKTDSYPNSENNPPNINPDNEYKIYTFQNVEATIEESYKTFKYGTWTKLSYEKNLNCSNGACNAEGASSIFTINVGISSYKIVGGEIRLSGNYSSSNDNSWDQNFRLSGTEGRYLSSIPVGFKNDLLISNSTSKTSNDWSAEFYSSGTKIGIKFSSSHAYGVGSTTTIFETRADTFYLSGYIIYR